MIRPLRDEVERYGHYALAAESMYDHPFQWGSKRTGPDLARVGGKYSDDWHVTHLTDPRVDRAGVDHAGLCVPGADRARLRPTAKAHLQVNRTLGVPYTDDQIDNATADMQAQAEPDGPGAGRSREALPEGDRPRLRRQTGLSPRWTR